MALYKLPVALYPLKDVFARNRDDILEWLNWFSSKNVEVLARPGSSCPGGIDDIVKVENGELLFDWRMPVRGNEFIEADLTPDFVAKIRQESVPSFFLYQSQLEERKLGNLYAVKTYNGWTMSLCFIPKDIFEALKTYDLSPHTERTRKHLKELNRILSKKEYFVRPSR